MMEQEDFDAFQDPEAEFEEANADDLEMEAAMFDEMESGPAEAGAAANAAVAAFLQRQPAFAVAKVEHPALLPFAAERGPGAPRTHGLAHAPRQPWHEACTSTSVHQPSDKASSLVHGTSALDALVRLRSTTTVAPS